MNWRNVTPAETPPSPPPPLILLPLPQNRWRFLQVFFGMTMRQKPAAVPTSLIPSSHAQSAGTVEINLPAHESAQKFRNPEAKMAER